MAVNEKVVLDTIKQMKEAELDDDVIIATLKDIGLSESEAKAFLVKATGESTTTPETDKEPETKTDETKTVEDPETKTVENPVPENDPTSNVTHTTTENPEDIDDASHAVTHVALNEQANKLDDLHEKVSEMKSPQELSALLNEVEALKRQVMETKKDVTEAKALSQATKELMEKVLEVNRKILNKL